MSKGSNKTVTNSSSSTAPDPTAYAAYQNLMSRATAVSNKPYEAYTGEETAGINDQQRAGFANINAGAEGFNPAQSWSDIGQGTSAVDANDISKYYDPYTQQVIDKTMADFDTMNQRANSTVTGNAAAQGALGGNRVGVAQALTQEGQERAQAPVIAGLRSAGFQSAEQMANQQKARQLQGGQTAEQLGMGAASAQVGAGTMEQQTQQAADTQKMQDYYRAQGYDFQTAQWLASLVLPTGSQMGTSSTGQSTTEGPKPNQWMQAAGLGVSAMAAYSDRRLKENVEEVGELHDGQKIYRYNFKGEPKTQIGLISQEVEKSHPEAVGESAGFGTVDYEAATNDAVKRFDGGRISGFAGGGTPSPWDAAATGWVPHATVTGSAIKGTDFPKHAQQEKQGDGMSKMGAGLGKIAKGLYDRDGTQGSNDLATDAPDNGTGMYTGDASMPGFAGSAPDLGGWGGASGYWARGGAVRRGFAEGGVPISTGFGGGFDEEELSPNDAVDERFANPMLGSDQYKNMGAHSEALKAEGALRAQPGAIANDAPMTPRPVKTSSFLPPQTTPRDEIVPKAMAAFKGIKAGVPPPKALGFAPQDPAPDDRAPDDDEGTSDATDFSARRRAAAGVGAAPSTSMGGFNPLNFSDEARQGLISMGLSMMANQHGGKGSALSSIGVGGMQGMTTYADAKAKSAAAAAAARKEAFEREKFERPYNEMTAEQRAKHNDGRYAIIPGVTTADGSPIERDTRHPNSPPINAITRKPLTPAEMSTVQTGGWKPFGDKVTADEAADPVLINPQGQVKNARTGQLLGSDAKLQSAKEVVLSGSNVDTRAYQLALGDTKGAYAGLPFGSGGNRPKALVREQAVSKLMNEGGMSEKEAAEYLSAQSQAFTATGTGLSAEARTAGVREANLKIILKATDAAIPAALEASQAVARTGWVPLNKIIEKGRVITSNPELKEFGMANLQLAEHWARAMNPTGVMRESDRDMALHFLSTTDSAATYARAVAQLKKQIDRELGAVQSVKSHGGFGAKVSEKDSTADTARKELTGGSGSPPPPARTAPPAAAAPPSQRTVVRTGKINSGPDAGKTVTEYSDGTREVK